MDMEEGGFGTTDSIPSTQLQLSWGAEKSWDHNLNAGLNSKISFET